MATCRHYVSALIALSIALSVLTNAEAQPAPLTTGTRAIFIHQQSDCTIALEPDAPSPQFVGTRIRWTATASMACGVIPVFRFSVSIDNGRTYQMSRDYAKRSWFDWSPMVEGEAGHRGGYVVRVQVKESYDSDAAAEATASYSVEAYQELPTVKGTGHPLVALYSAPACHGAYRTVHVEFSEAGAARWRPTHDLPCVPGKSRNFLVAGMKPLTTYLIRHVLSSGKVSPPLEFTTGEIPAGVTVFPTTVFNPIDDLTDTDTDIIWNTLGRGVTRDVAVPVATTLDGAPLWYSHLPTFAAELSAPSPVRMLPTGKTVMMARDAETPPAALNSGQTVVRIFDLDGTPRWETNSFAVSSRTNVEPNPFRVWDFHREALPLDNGNLVIMATTLRCLPSDTDGDYACSTSGDSLWLGDALVVVDPEGEVVWKWNSFDAGHINPYRPPPLAYPLCAPPGPECIIANARSYTHGNAVALAHDDAGTQLLMNARYQNWALKIDFSDGEGDGRVLWRFGADGCWNNEAPCFETDNPSNWFSHEHNVHFARDGSLLLFDNGNNRCAGFDPHFCPYPSRGQVWSLDEQSMTANPSGLNFEFEDAIGLDGNPFKMYSQFLGVAQKLPSGNYFFLAGGTKPATCGTESCNQPLHAYGIEVGFRDGVPKHTYTYRIPASSYRAYRMATLYEGTDR